MKKLTLKTLFRKIWVFSPSASLMQSSDKIYWFSTLYHDLHIHFYQLVSWFYSIRLRFQAHGTSILDPGSDNEFISRCYRTYYPTNSLFQTLVASPHYSCL